MAYFGPPDMFAEADEVHVSVAFTWDKAKGEQLAEQWRHVAPVTIGGPAYEKDGQIYPIEFEPGRYIKAGYTFTSRGCPRRCWFCSVWKRIPEATPLSVVHDGWNVLDDNLLACPEPHVRRVFDMLKRQPRRVEFTGGLEALSLQDYQVDLLASLRPRPVMFWAYDPQDAYETLAIAARKLLAAGFTRESHRLRCYVLIGYPRDTFDAATKRLTDMIDLGFTPMAMLWQPERPAEEKHRPGPEWRAFQRRWARPAIIHAQRPEYPAPRIWMLRQLAVEASEARLSGQHEPTAPPETR